jgi:hypothetical protein
MSSIVFHLSKTIHERYMYNNVHVLVVTEWYHWFPFIIHYIVNISKIMTQSIFKRIWHDCLEFRLYVLYLQCSYTLKLHFKAYRILCLCAYCMNVNKVFSYTTRICFKTNCQLTNYLNQLYWWQYSYTSFDFCNNPINIVLMYFFLLHN